MFRRPVRLRPPGLWRRAEMYSGLIELADATLAANNRLRTEAAGLRAQAKALRLRSRGPRFQPISGASDARQDHGVRRLLRDFFSGSDTPKSYAGYSRGSVCG